MFALVVFALSAIVAFCFHLLIRSFPIAVLCTIIAAPALIVFIGSYINDNPGPVDSYSLGRFVGTALVAALIVGLPFWLWRRRGKEEA